MLQLICAMPEWGQSKLKVEIRKNPYGLTREEEEMYLRAGLVTLNLRLSKLHPLPAWAQRLPPDRYALPTETPPKR